MFPVRLHALAINFSTVILAMVLEKMSDCLYVHRSCLVSSMSCSLPPPPVSVALVNIFRTCCNVSCSSTCPSCKIFAPSAPFVKTRQQPCLVLTTSPQSRWKEDNKEADTRIIYQLRDEIFTSYYISLNCCISVCYIDLQDRNVICGIYFWMERMRVFERKQN